MRRTAADILAIGSITIIAVVVYVCGLWPSCDDAERDRCLRRDKMTGEV